MTISSSYSTATTENITGEPGDQVNPIVWDIYVVYVDERDGSLNLYDTRTKETRKLVDIGNLKGTPRIHQNRVVYSSDIEGSYDIYVYDLGRDEVKRITNGIWGEVFPDIYGRYVVYVDWGEYSVRLYDLETSSDRTLADGFGRLIQPPRIHKNRVVISAFMEGLPVRAELSVYDISTGQKDKLLDQMPSHPVINEGRVFWHSFYYSKIRMYDLSTRAIRNLTDIDFDSSDMLNAGLERIYDVYGSSMVFINMDYDDFNLYKYDLTNHDVVELASASGHQINPSIWKGEVVWEDWRSGDSEIYLTYIETASSGLTDDEDIFPFVIMVLAVIVAVVLSILFARRLSKEKRRREDGDLTHRNAEPPFDGNDDYESK